MAGHTFASQSGGAGCTVCGLAVYGRALWWLTDCPGVPYYGYAEMPAQLATRTTLDREGLRAADAPAGYYVAWQRKAVVLLYDRTAARPKRALSAAQRVALDRAQEALRASRTCTECGRLVQSRRYLSLIGEGAAARRLCSACVERHEIELDRAGVYATATQWLAEDANGTRPLRVLDTETTGLYDSDELVELAIVDAAGVPLVHSLVRPSVPIAEEAAAVHGLTAADLAGAPALAEVWPQVRKALRGARIVTYNADFDRRMLAQSAERYSLKRPACEWDCLMELCAALDVNEDFSGRWVSLPTVCWWLGIAPGGHRALGDALAALGVLRELARRAETHQEAPADAIC